MKRRVIAFMYIGIAIASALGEGWDRRLIFTGLLLLLYVLKDKAFKPKTMSPELESLLDIRP